MGRSRPVGRKIYTLSYLLEKQPKSLQKIEHYSLMISSLKNSHELYTFKFNKRCYSLLNNGIIKPEHLDNFYRTYRLPKHPFFPLFFMVKRNYLREREEKKREREEYVNRVFGQMPFSIRDFFNRLEELEKMYHPSGRTPVLKSRLIAKTKKRADSYSHFSHEEWIECFEAHLTRLREKYERLPKDRCDRLLSYYILLSVPPSLFTVQEESVLRKNYRTLSKTYHPDAGGDSRVFLKIRWARDVLSIR